MRGVRNGGTINRFSWSLLPTECKLWVERLAPMSGGARAILPGQHMSTSRTINNELQTLTGLNSRLCRAAIVLASLSLAGSANSQARASCGDYLLHQGESVNLSDAPGHISTNVSSMHTPSATPAVHDPARRCHGPMCSNHQCPSRPTPAPLPNIHGYEHAWEQDVRTAIPPSLAFTLVMGSERSGRFEPSPLFRPPESPTERLR